MGTRGKHAEEKKKEERVNSPDAHRRVCCFGVRKKNEGKSWVGLNGFGSCLGYACVSCLGHAWVMRGSCVGHA
eukprot:262983-Rhodomonas_salina.1